VRVPRYHRIAEALRERIRDGELTAGERLPNQRQLAHQFGVTLMTLRQALEVLEREKLIDRRHGLGTFVAAPSIDYDILALRRFAGDLTALGEQVTTRVLGNLFGVADRRVAAALGLGSFLPPAVGEDVLKSDLTTTPLRQVLELKLGLPITRARETVAAVRLGPREARELGCAAGVPAFESERVSYSGARAVVFDRVFIPGDRFRITRELTYEQQA